MEVFVGFDLTPTGKTSCLAWELQQEKLVVVDLRRGWTWRHWGMGEGKNFSTDSHAAVQTKKASVLTCVV